MLTPANMFLLGVIDARPTNPYEIVSRFEYNRYKAILGIADSTIYANLRAMCGKGLIQFELRQEGGMPAKKVYSPTELGRSELKASISAYLSGSASGMTGFSIALLLMHYFTREELLSLLERHRAALEPVLAERESDYRFVAEIHDVIPCVPNVASAQLIYAHVKAELEVTCQTMELLRRDEPWPQSTFALDPEYHSRYVQWLGEETN